MLCDYNQFESPTIKIRLVITLILFILLLTSQPKPKEKKIEYQESKGKITRFEEATEDKRQQE